MSVRNSDKLQVHTDMILSEILQENPDTVVIPITKRGFCLYAAWEQRQGKEHKSGAIVHSDLWLRTAESKAFFADVIKVGKHATVILFDDVVRYGRNITKQIKEIQELDKKANIKIYAVLKHEAMKKNVQKAQKHTHSELDKIANDLLKSFYHSAVPYAGFAPITEVKLLEQTQADNIIGQLCNAGFVEKTTYIEASGNTRRFTLPVSKERIAEIFGESFGKVVQFAYIDAFFYAVGLTGRERLRLIPTVCMNPMEAEQISAALSMLLGDGSADQEDPYIQASLLNYLLASILLSKALPFEPEAIDHKYDIEHIGKAWAARLPEIVSTLTEKSLCDMAFDVRLAEWPEEEETIKYYNTGELGKTMSADSMRDQYNLAERKRNKASPIRRLLRLNSDSSDYDSQVLEVSGILASGVGVGLIRVRRDDPELYAPSATAGEMAYAADWELRPLFQRFYEEHVGTFLVNYWRKRGKLYRNFAKKVNQSNDPAGKLFKERVKEALECSGEKFKKHNVQMIDIKMATLLGTTGFVSLSEVQPEAVPAITIGTAEVAGVGK